MLDYLNPPSKILQQKRAIFISEERLEPPPLPVQLQRKITMIFAACPGSSPEEEANLQEYESNPRENKEPAIKKPRFGPALKEITSWQIKNKVPP